MPPNASDVDTAQLHRDRPGLVGHHIDLTFRIRVGVVNRGRDYPVSNRQRRNRRFEAACRPQRVSQHRFDRRDGKAPAAIAEDESDPARFGAIVVGRGGSVRVHMIDFVGVHRRIRASARRIVVAMARPSGSGEVGWKASHVRLWPATSA